MDEQKEKAEVVAIAREKKKSFMAQLKETFVAKDIREVVKDVNEEYIVPNIKKGIFDTFTNGLGLFLGVESKKSSSASVPGSQVSYRSFYDKKNAEENRPFRARTRYSMRDMLFDDRGDAEKVLENLNDRIAVAHSVSAGDFLDMCGCPTNFTDYKYGWTDLRGVGVYRSSDGYRIDLPRPEPLD